MTIINFRKAREGDFEKVAALQNQNLFSFLSEEDRRDGFLSTKFTPQNLFLKIMNWLYLLLPIQANTKVGMEAISKFNASGNDFWIVIREMKN